MELTHLRLTQLALSIQIKAFEAELGAALFTRHRKQMQLTQASEIFYRHARSC
jgi:DNA-binding transcriptional LysR family regulator